MEENNNLNNENSQEERGETGQQNRISLPEGQPQNNQYNQSNQRPPKKKSVLLPVLVIILAFVFLFGSVFSFVLRIFSGAVPFGAAAGSKNDDSLNFRSPYIAELSIEGTIQGDTGDSLTSTQTYHHTWTVKKIKQLKSDTNNRGLIIHVNTPGGGVYESDELYLALKDYRESTGRPVYSYMASQATSGGYYISSACDRIFANRNCWTGSIGVTIGTMYDIRGLLKKYGIKTVTINSGANKSMGSMTDELTLEQQEILQGLVDEAYEQFVGIVAEGRKMKVSDVKKLADGRLYTAKQAKENGLIDEIGSFDDAVGEMKKKYELENCLVQKIDYPENSSFLRDLLRSFSQAGKSDTESELGALESLIEKNGKFSVTYMAPVDR